MDTIMSSKFPELAAELVQQIANNLEPADLGSLRLTCRTIYQDILQQFSIINFATVRTDLTPRSLQRLQDISRSEFAPYIACLRFAGTVDDTPKTQGTLGKGLHWHRHSSGHLIPPLPVDDLLREVLMHKSIKCRSFWIESFDEGNEGRLPYVDDYITPSDVVGTLLSIIAQTGLAITSFTVENSTRGNSTGRLDTPRLQIPYISDGYQFETGWAHLQDLILQCDLTHDAEDWAFNLIKTAPNLQKLTLQFYEGGASLFRQLAGSTNSISTLEHLSIKSAHVSEPDLSTVLFKTQHSLRSLFLNCVDFDSTGGWAKLFKGMKGNFPHLSSLELFFLREQHKKVEFSKLRQCPKVPGSEVKTRVGEEDRLKADSRYVEGMRGAIDVKYKWQRELQLAIAYKGPDMDVVLGVLLEAAIKSL